MNKNTPSLVILAAGMASRYGANKQIEKFGHSGETIMEFSIYDAMEAGFGKVIFVIREEFAASFIDDMESKLLGKIETAYVFQDLKRLTKGKPVATSRTKPFGTQHALLCAQEAIDGVFAVINADDFYGNDAFEKAYQFLSNEISDTHFGCIAYPLGNTLSLNGAVTRGEIIASGSMIEKIIERKKIAFNGRDAFTLDSPELKTLPLDTPVSMNFFCFTSDFLHLSNKKFEKFLSNNLNQIDAEFLIPEVVDQMLEEKTITVTMIKTDAKWFGVTYKDDAGWVRENLRALVRNGVYPTSLWITTPNGQHLPIVNEAESENYTPYDLTLIDAESSAIFTSAKKT